MAVEHSTGSTTSRGLTPPERDYTYSVTVIPGLIRIFDLLAILFAAVISFAAVMRYSPSLIEPYGFCVVFILFVSTVLMDRAELYDINAIMRPVSRADFILVAIVTSFLFFLTIAFSLKVSDIYSRLWLFTFAGTSFAAVVTFRIIACRVLRALSRRSVIGRSMAVLGGGRQGRQFLARLNKVQPYFTTVAGVFDADQSQIGETVEGHKVKGDLEALIEHARTRRVDDVVIAMPWQADHEVTSTIEKLKELPINVYIASDLVGFQLAFRPVMGSFHEMPMFEVVQRPIAGWSSVLKLIEDYLLASIGLLLLSPLLILVAIAIKLDSRGPVFFMQERLGFNNQVFHIYKFRSMHHEEVPDHIVKQATRDDPRVTRVGRIIRATSIDELPQLLNVLNGTMSLVGPRPHAISHNEEYGREIRGYFARHKVKPGITGWAQVNGLRGETETLDKMADRVAHDIYYTENWSLLFDLRILVTTVLVVMFQKTAF